MHVKKFSKLIGVAALAASAALANSIDSVVVYGDSLSDNGNLYSEVHLPGPPYYGGRASNGPVAVEQLASLLNVKLTDFAFAGATTGIGDTLDGGSTSALGAFQFPGMLTQFESAASQSTIAKDPGGLYIVWGGPNDFFNLPANSTPAQVAAAISTSVTDLLTIVDGLRAKGVTDILVPGMPDLGLTPDYLSKGSAASQAATALTSAFNAALISQLPAGVKYFNTQGLLEMIVANPSAYGFSNVTQACFTTISLCSNPNSYLFFDSDHPTTYADSIVADQFLSVVTPEPGTFAGAGMAILAILFVARRKVFSNAKA